MIYLRIGYQLRNTLAMTFLRFGYDFSTTWLWFDYNLPYDLATTRFATWERLAYDLVMDLLLFVLRLVLWIGYNLPWQWYIQQEFINHLKIALSRFFSDFISYIYFQYILCNRFAITYMRRGYNKFWLRLGYDLPTTRQRLSILFGYEMPTILHDLAMTKSCKR